MKILTSYGEGRLTVYLTGELDHHSAKECVTGIADSIDTYLPSELVLDMSELSFMDSSGIAVIVKTNRKITACGGRMLIENPAAQPYKVLDAAGMARIVPIFAKGEVTT